MKEQSISRSYDENARLQHVLKRLPVPSVDTVRSFIGSMVPYLVEWRERVQSDSPNSVCVD